MEGYNYFIILESVYNWVQCIVVIVIKFDKLEYVICFLGVREVLWVICVNYCYNKEWQLGNNKNFCNESESDGQFQIFFESLFYSLVFGNVLFFWLGVSELVN